MNTWLSRSYPQSDKVWSTEDRAWRRGKCRVYGIVREEFFSWINSHVVDVLKVARRGDQTGVMMRELIRGTLLSKTTERESNEGWLYKLHGHQQFCKSSETQSRDSRQQTLLAVSTQGLTLPPPVLWAPSWHSLDGPAALASAKTLETNKTFNSLGIDSNIYYFLIFQRAPQL